MLGSVPSCSQFFEVPECPTSYQRPGLHCGMRHNANGSFTFAPMDFHLWLLYAVSTTLGSLLPGSGSILSMNYGLNAGMRKTAAAIAGMEVALVCHISVAALGLGALLATSQTAFLAIKWLGAA